MRLACVTVMACLAGCTATSFSPPGDANAPPEDGARGDGSPDPDGGVLPPIVTYREHVAPLLQRHCVTCHVANGIAPFVLDSYASAFSRRLGIQSSTVSREMPPWGPLDDGSCQTWQHSRFLPQLAIDTFGRWVDQGAVEGDPSIPIPSPPTLPTLAGANARGTMTASYALQAAVGGDEYRCFQLNLAATGVLPAPDASGRVLVTGFDISPGNRELVHHVIVWATTAPPGDVDGIIAAKAAEDAAPGWACSGGANVAVALDTVAVWAPGTGATNYPAPTGIAVRSDTRLIMQVHYAPHQVGLHADPGTSIDLAAVAISPTSKIANWYSVANYALSIPPNAAAHPVTATASFAQFTGVPAGIAGLVYGIYPHMHTAGSSITLRRNTSQCLIDVPAWDFHWQSAYFMSQPLAFSTSDPLTLGCTYNTQGRTTTTVYGESTSDEMCLALLYAAPQ